MEMEMQMQMGALSHSYIDIYSFIYLIYKQMCPAILNIRPHSNWKWELRAKAILNKSAKPFSQKCQANPLTTPLSLPLFFSINLRNRAKLIKSYNPHACHRIINGVLPS